jgi:putative glutamine amidotransferase
MDNSFLYNVFQAKQIQVNSIHHQAIKTLWNNLISTGMSEDWYIEAIEHKDKKIYGFQWHPECLWDHLPIFKKFIEKI